jgi:hypothetical protein
MRKKIISPNLSARLELFEDTQYVPIFSLIFSRGTCTHNGNDKMNEKISKSFSTFLMKNHEI